MRIDALGAMAIMSMVLPTIATVAIIWNWRRWSAPLGAKVFIVLGIFFLLIPGTCFGIGIGGEALGLFAPYHP